MSEKMKAAALSAATKGLSRVQAERATANANRNVNAYGQKEEGPSRWQEKKEAKAQMYLKSTEKQATLNQKRCQKCRQPGHWTYECQKPALETPKFEAGSLYSRDLDVDLKKEKGEKGLKKKKIDKSSKRKHKRRKYRSSSSSESSDDSRSHKRKHKKRKHRYSSSSESSDYESEDERGRKRKRHSRKSNGGR